MKKLLPLVLCNILLLLTVSSCSKKPKEDFAVLDKGNISVISLQSVDGLFVEKGGSEEVKGAAAIEVKNNSGQMLEYGVISFKVNTYEQADFEVSALPPGESVIVMESFARTYSKDDEYVVNKNGCMFGYCDASVQVSGIDVKTEGSDITVTNNTGEPKNVTIVYKYYNNDSYYGGIAFRGKFENIAPGESVTKTSERFNENCRIVNILTESIEIGGNTNEQQNG